MDAPSERRLVTALFIDVVGSSEATSRLGPERMRRVLDEAFSQMSARIAERGGTVEKYVGDAIFALFGVPTAHADDPERALHAANECVRWSLADSSDSSNVAVRIGIETGEALVDLAAVESRERIAVGDTINFAARLMQLAAPGEIVVGPLCHRMTETAAEYSPLGVREFKGLGRAEAWRFMTLGVHGPPSLPFVGRHEELRTLASASDRAMGGTAVLAAIIGPPGQGKSRLAGEAVRRCAGVPVWQGRCRPGTETGVMTPLRQLLQSDIPSPTAETVAGRLSDLLGRGEGAPAAEAISHSAGIAAAEQLLVLSRLEQRELIAEAWRRYIDAVARGAGLVVFVEDVHWADPVLLRVLDRATTELSARLFVVVTARPEFSGSPQIRPSSSRVEIVLPALDRVASEDLARSAGGDPVETRRAAGNPLFIIELARAGLDRGAAAAGAPPVTIQATIGARLDELPVPERDLLQLASVVGDEFDLHDAALLADREPAEVASLLGRVTHLGFVEPVGTRYRFHHALIRDVAYGRLPVERRMREHAHYASEGVHPDDAEARAHHWWQALEPADAEWVWTDEAQLPWMRREGCAAHMAAGRRLEQRNAYEEALEVYTRARALADNAADMAHSEAALGRAFASQGRGDDAWRHRLQAIEAFATAGIEPPADLFADLLEVAAWNWGYFQQPPRDEEIIRLLDEGEGVARRSGDDVSLARLLIQRAAYTDQLAGADEIREFLELPEPERFADAAQRAAELYLLDGRIGEAVDLYRIVFDRLVRGGAAINEPEALLWYGLATLQAGDLTSADALATRLEAEAFRRSPHTRQHAMGLRGLIQFVRGEWDALRATRAELTALVQANEQASFCLIGAALPGYAAAADVLTGGRAPEDLEALVARIAVQSELIQAAVLMLPEALAGYAEAVQRGLRAYEPGLRLVDRARRWDVSDLIPGIALTALERWDDLDERLLQMDRFAAHGGRLAAATASAIREETDAARGGPPPQHEELRAIGCLGLSALLGFRAANVDRRGSGRAPSHQSGW